MEGSAHFSIVNESWLHTSDARVLLRSENLTISLEIYLEKRSKILSVLSPIFESTASKTSINIFDNSIKQSSQSKHNRNHALFSCHPCSPDKVPGRRQRRKWPSCRVSRTLFSLSSNRRKTYRSTWIFPASAQPRGSSQEPCRAPAHNSQYKQGRDTSCCPRFQQHLGMFPRCRNSGLWLPPVLHPKRNLVPGRHLHSGKLSPSACARIQQHL